MQIIDPYYVIEKMPTTDDLKLIENIGRVCYKSETKATEDSFKKFLEHILHVVDFIFKRNFYWNYEIKYLKNEYRRICFF